MNMPTRRTPWMCFCSSVVWSMDGVETGGREFSLGQIQPYRLGIWNFFFDRYQIGERNNLYFLPCPMEHAGHP